MELTRRDAVAALAVVGAAGGIGVAARNHIGGTTSGNGDGSGDALATEVMVAAAEVVYPAAITGTTAFVEAFLEGRLAREDHATGVRETTAKLDELARAWHGDRFAALSPDDRHRLLREVGADTADEDPDGTTAERVRFYVVNELLLALYASPAGGELVGIENPQGHPGGTDTYQRGPPT